MKKLLILLLTVSALFGQFKFQRSLPDRYTVFQLNGAPVGSTVFKDASQYNNTITTYGNTVQSATQKKFGDGSVYFDGTDDYLSVPASSLFDFGTSKFTIDFWIYWPAISNTRAIFGQYVGSNNYFTFYQYSGTTLRFNDRLGGSVRAWWYVNYTLSVNTWYHISIVRNGINQTDWYCFVNGISQTIVNDAGVFNAAAGISTVPFCVSGYGIGSSYENMYLQEFRISKGIARWTSNFTPPNRY